MRAVIARKLLQGIKLGSYRFLTQSYLILSCFIVTQVVQAEGLELSPEEQKYLSSINELSICHLVPRTFTGADYQGQLSAISMNYIQAIARQSDLKVSRRLVHSLAEAKSYLLSGKCLLIPGLTPKEVADESLLQTNAFLTMPLVFVSARESNLGRSFKQLFSNRVSATQKFANSNQLAVRLPDYQFVLVETIEQGLEKVSQGEVEAFVAPLMQVGNYLQNNYIPNLKLSAELQEHWNLVMAVAPENAHLQSIVNKSLDNISPTTKNVINNRWIRVNYHYETDRHLLYSVIIIGGLFFIGLLYRHILLSRHNRNLTRISQTDKLTGLYNRVKTDEALNYHINSFRRYDDVFSIILLDIDNFKLINDQYGHIVGDEILVKVSNQLTSSCRNTDIIGRWGGEEFLIISPKTDLEHAKQITKKLMQSIQEISINEDSSEANNTISASFGIAEIAIEDTKDTLVTRADFALLSAKQNGKNQYVLAKASLNKHTLVEKFAS